MEASPSPPGSARSRSSQELEIGHRLGDLWDVQEPLLTPSEKLNSCFDKIPVSAFPAAAASESQVVEIPSDSSLAAAVEILSRNKILSAPVRNVDAPEDSTWIDRYIGIVEFAGIAVWLLQQSGVACIDGPELAVHTELSATDTSPPDCSETSTQSPRLDMEEVPSTGGSFFQDLISSELYKNAKVQDISGSFRWAPFLPVQSSDSFLTMLLLLSKYKMKALPVIDLGDPAINNVVTQSAVVHMLAECAGLDWFEKWGTKMLFEVGLPMMKSYQLVKIYEEEPVLKAFELMWKKGIGGLPVVEESGKKAVGNISIRDVQFLLLTPEIYKDYRSITAANFLTAKRKYLEEQEGPSPLLHGVITCKRNDMVKDVILKLDTYKIHRIYVVNDDGHLQGVITLRDIISKLVHEPPGYFGDFFDGVVPLPGNSNCFA